MRYIWDAFDIYFPREGAECEVWADAPLGAGGGRSAESAIPQRIKRMALRRAALALRPRLRRRTAPRRRAWMNSWPIRNVARKIHRYYGAAARVIPRGWIASSSRPAPPPSPPPRANRMTW
jgi:hypothetical protein